ncbi:MAG: hypothetical protein K6A80_09805 [Saccharofermentans sp.]|nr:hypothetical protein [Saccharofermentans sp.]
MDNIGALIFWAIVIVLAAFIIFSVIMFIRDGKLAKKEGRKRKIVFIVLFIISVIIALIAVALGILLCLLAMAVMHGM